MANPRKPTKLKQLQGTLKPCRNNPNEPIPVGLLGMPPSDLEPEEKLAWFEISESIAPGVATNSDQMLIEIVAKLMAQFRAGTIAGWGMAALMRGLSQLGMTPADRSKIVVIEKKQKSKWLK